jgi:hypothetical protein
MAILGIDLKDSHIIIEAGKIDAPLLLFGLMFREVSRAMEIEEGTDPKVPIHLRNSPFGIKELNAMENLLDDVVVPK